MSTSQELDRVQERADKTSAELRRTQAELRVTQVIMFAIELNARFMLISWKQRTKWNHKLSIDELVTSFRALSRM